MAVRPSRQQIGFSTGAVRHSRPPTPLRPVQIGFLGAATPLRQVQSAFWRRNASSAGADRLSGRRNASSTGAVRHSRPRNASSAGADRLSGRRIAFWVPLFVLGPFRVRFRQKLRPIGLPAPRSWNVAQKASSSGGLGRLDLHRPPPSALSPGLRPQPSAAGLRPQPPASAARAGLRRPADLRPPKFSSAPRPADGARPAAPA